MHVLVCGASGFIGNAIAGHLKQAGHTVVKGVRHPRADDEIAVDYAHDFVSDQWLTRLHGIDAVVNAVGIIVEMRGSRFDDVHRKAPIALFDACRQAGIKRVLQISALGADIGDTAYFRSKRAADEFLMAQPMEWQIVRPALVYGKDGSSARMFRMLSSLPLLFFPAGGIQKLQPVHIEDLAEAVLQLLDPGTPPRQCVELAGSAEVEYRGMLRIYRSAMKFPPAFEVTIPASLISLAANTIGRIPGVILTADNWKMLRAGNTGNAAALSGLLGRVPLAPLDFISEENALALRQEALATWRTPMLRAALALVWIISGLASAFVYPVAQSLEMLARVGLGGGIAVAALYGASVLDIVLGLLSLVRPGRSLWLIQMAVIAGYTAIIAFALPEYLYHPFGPITKNLPILAILLILFAEERTS